MGSATIVATAFALILLMITAYFLVAVVLTTAEIVSFAQQDKLNQQELRVRTSINIDNTSIGSSSTLYTEIKNDGSVVISDFKYWDVYTGNDSTNSPLYYYKGDNTGEWNIISIEPDIINPGLLDPQEVLNISIKYQGNDPLWVQVTTPNGVSASAYT